MTDKNEAAARQAILEQVTAYAEAYYGGGEFKAGESAVPPSGKVIGAPEMRLMVEAALDGWLTTGRFNDQFQKRLSRYLGIRSVLTVNSGSSANLVALSALTSPQLGKRTLKPGDEVITAAAGFPTTVNPILQQGLSPVFIDVELGTYNATAQRVADAIGPKTRAIMLAHTLGNPYEVEEIASIAKENGLWLVEDCCDALGSTYNDKLVGSFGDFGTLSFYPAHHITMGEGGAVFTRRTKLKKIAESFRDWGRDCYCEPGEDNTCKQRFEWELGELPYGYDHKYIYSHLGYNLKITDMQAACGLAQMDRLPEFIETRQRNFDYLTAELQALDNELILPQATANSRPSWFGYPITLSGDTDRTELLRYLDHHKVGTRLLFAGNLLRQPYFQDHKAQIRVAGSLDNTDTIMNKTFWIGCYPGLTEESLSFTADRLKSFFGLTSVKKLS